MSPAKIAPEAMEALSLELQEVQWFGRATMEHVPARVAPLDLLLVVAGALTGVMVYLVGPV